MLRNVYDWSHMCSDAGIPVPGVSSCHLGWCKWSNTLHTMACFSPSSCPLPGPSLLELGVMLPHTSSSLVASPLLWWPLAMSSIPSAVLKRQGQGCNRVRNLAETWTAVKSLHWFSSECFRSSPCFPSLRFSAEAWRCPKVRYVRTLSAPIPCPGLLYHSFFGQVPHCPQLLIGELVPPGGGSSRTKIH